MKNTITLDPGTYEIVCRAMDVETKKTRDEKIAAEVLRRLNWHKDKK